MPPRVSLPPTDLTPEEVARRLMRPSTKAPIRKKDRTSKQPPPKLRRASK